MMSFIAGIAFIGMSLMVYWGVRGAINTQWLNVEWQRYPSEYLNRKQIVIRTTLSASFAAILYLSISLSENKWVLIFFAVSASTIFALFKEFSPRLLNNSSSTQTSIPPETTSLRNGDYEITYEDIDGNYSSRKIDIERVYKKGGRIYVDAYCYLMADTRTFRVDRIMSMKYCSNDESINNVSLFFKSRL